MSQVLIPDIDEAVVERLEARARQRGRSLEAELKAILHEAAELKPTRAQYRALAEHVRSSIENGPHTDSVEILQDDRLR
jgi:plasmid stability protein